MLDASKKQGTKWCLAFLAKGYKKDIFGSFVYEFELSHN